MSVHADVWSEAGPPPDLVAIPPPAEADSLCASEALASTARAAVSAVLARRQAARPTIGGYLRALARLVDELPREPIERLVALLYLTRSQQRRVLVLGAGEAAATASCFASDLNRATLGSALVSPRAVALIGADGRLEPPDAVAERYASRVRELARVDDLVLVIACAGEEVALAPALEAATRTGATTALLTSQGGTATPTADLAIVVPTERAEHVRGAHLYIEYVVCAALRSLERSFVAWVAQEGADPLAARQGGLAADGPPHSSARARAAQ